MNSIILNTDEVRKIQRGERFRLRKLVRFRDPDIDNFQDNIAFACPSEVVSGFYPECWWFSLYSPKDRITFSVDVPYTPGEYVIVKETWNHGYLRNIWANNYSYIVDTEFCPTDFRNHFSGHHENGDWFYRADQENIFLEYTGMTWKSASCMPWSAARFLIEINEIYTERLQDVSDSELHNERFDSKEDFFKYWDRHLDTKKRLTHGWNANPYVWVIDFNFYSGKELLLP